MEEIKSLSLRVCQPLAAMGLTGSRRAVSCLHEEMPSFNFSAAKLRRADPALLRRSSQLRLAEYLDTLSDKQERSGKYQEAVKNYARVVAMREKQATENDFQLLKNTYYKYSRLLGHTDEALAESYKKREPVLCEKTPGNINLLNGLNSIADFYLHGGKIAPAAPYLERVILIERKRDPGSTRSVQKLATLYMGIKDYAHAEPLLKTWLAELEKGSKIRGPGYANYSVIAVVQMLGVAALKQDKINEARGYLERARQLYEKAKGEHGGEPHSPAFLLTYAEYLEKVGRAAEAVEYRKRSALAQQKNSRRCLACGMG